MSEQPPALDPATLRWAADRLYGDERAAGEHSHPLSIAAWLRDLAAGEHSHPLSIASWLRDLAAQAEQQAATQLDLRETLGSLWEVFRKHRPQGAYLPTGTLDGDCHAAECGGEWPCEAVMDALAAAGVLASTPRPEGETRVEWAFALRRADGSFLANRPRAVGSDGIWWNETVTAEEARRSWYPNHTLVRRTVTSFPDVVGEWVPVDQDGDDR